MERTKQVSIAASILSVTLVTVEARADSWYWVPTQITNAQAGDSILTSNPNGLIGTLLGSLGQFWSHSGMFIDNGYDIRHNTGDPSALNTVGSPVPSKINSGDLYAMKPGIITQGVPDAFGDHGHAEFNLFDSSGGDNVQDRNAVILKRNGPAVGNGQSTYDASSTMLEYEAMYSFYSYTDIWTTEPDPTDPDHLHVSPDLNRRNMCAGTIAWALFSGGSFDVWPWAYTEQMRNQAAPVLYNAIYNLVGSKLPGSGIPFISNIVTLIAGGARSNIANQIVNCMAFQECDNTGDHWRSGVGTGASISPDNLVPAGFINSKGAAWGMSGYDPNNPASIWYDTVEPVSYTGGYWKKY
jgi:hypothetical protein